MKTIIKKSLTIVLTLLMVVSMGTVNTSTVYAEDTSADELQDITIGEVDFKIDKYGFYTSEGHVEYTYYDDKTCAHSAKDPVTNNYFDGGIAWVKTVTITGLNFAELTDSSEEMSNLKSLIMNGRRTDTGSQFKDSITVNFVNCTFNQQTSHLQVYKILPCNAIKYTFDNCTFNQSAQGQYAITLNCSETSFDSRPISYDIVNSTINSSGRGINIAAGTETNAVGTNLPKINISKNAFNLPSNDSKNMCIQIAGDWSNASLASESNPVITVSNNEFDAYTALRVHDSMALSDMGAAAKLFSFSDNELKNDTKPAVVDSSGIELTEKLAGLFGSQIKEESSKTYIAQIGTNKYETLAAALIAANSGDIIEILDGTYDAEKVGKLDPENVYTNANIVRHKSLTIKAAEGANPVFTSSVNLGYDDSSTTNATMTVKGLTFKDAVLTISNYVQVTVEDCNLSYTKVNHSDYKPGTLIILDSCCTNHKKEGQYPESKIVINNVNINGSPIGWNTTSNAEDPNTPTLRLRNTGSVIITNSTFENARHNGILFESNKNVDNSVPKTISITNNTITEWNRDNNPGGGRAVRMSLADTQNLTDSSTVTIKGNTFTKGTVGLDKPDFVKVTGLGNAEIDLNNNSWNNETLSTINANKGDYYTTDLITTDSIKFDSVKTYVAKIGDNKYETLADAFENVSDNETITLLIDCSGNGIIVPSGKKFTVDFNNYTYTVNTNLLAGSNGTKNQCFQLLKDSTITFKNGSIVADNAAIKMIIQNYANLTLDNMVIDATQGTNSVSYAVSTNNGKSVIKDTAITAKEKGVAFDVYSFGTYTGNNVTVEGDSKIIGKIELGAKNDAPKTLTINGGNFSKSSIVVIDGGDTAVVTKGENVILTVPEDYMWNSEGKLIPAAAKIGDAKYETFGEAFSEVKTGEAIKLFTDVDVSTSGLKVTKEITLNLNGHNIKAGESFATNIYVAKTGNLTVKDSVGTGKIYTEVPYSSVNGAGIVRVSGGIFTLESGNIEAVIENDPANKGQFGIVLDGGATVNINGGVIKAGWYSISNNGNDTSTNTVNINDGTLISTADYSIYNPGKNSVVNINNGVVYGATGGVALNAGSLNVTGGTITSKGVGSTGNWGDGTGGLSNAAIYVNAKYNNATATITGGKIIAEGNAVTLTTGTTYEGTIAVSGGTFSSAVPAEYCVKGYNAEQHSNGTWTVKAQYVAEIGSHKYESLQAAIEAAEPYGTVRLIANEVVDVSNLVTNAGAININKSIVINGNGHKITAVNAGTTLGHVMNVTADHVTIKDITIDAANVANVKAALNVWNADSIGLENVVLENAMIGMIMNGSSVRIEGSKTNIKNGSYKTNGIAAAINVDTSVGNSALAVVSGTVGGIYTDSTSLTNTVKIEIEGGNVDFVRNVTTNTNNLISVSGGTFKNPVDQIYCAPGYEPRDKGNNEYGVLQSSVLTTDIGEKTFVAGGDWTEFSFSTEANGHSGVLVVCESDFGTNPNYEDKIDELQYWDGRDWQNMKGQNFGPPTGFELTDATSKFRVKFIADAVGTYNFSVSIKTVNGNNELCAIDVPFKVTKPGLLSTDIDKKTFVAGGDYTEFTFSTEAIHPFGYRYVIGGSDFGDENESKIAALEYKEGEDWKDMKGQNFGPATGFPLVNTTSTFRVKFTSNAAGNYNFNAFLKDATTGEVLCEISVPFKVIDAVAKTGTGTDVKYFGSVQEAWDSKTGDIHLLKDVNESIKAVENLTLKLDGHNFTGSIIAGYSDHSSVRTVQIYGEAGSTLTLNNIICNGLDIGNSNSLTATINDGFVNGQLKVYSNSKLTINGGEFYSTSAPEVSTKDTLLINRGTFGFDPTNYKAANRYVCTVVGAYKVGEGHTVSITKKLVDNSVSGNCLRMDIELVGTMDATSQHFIGGTPITVKAPYKEDNYEFVGWSIDGGNSIVTGSPIYILPELNSDLEFVAVYKLDPRAENVTNIIAGPNGTVTYAAGNTVPAGGRVSISVVKPMTLNAVPAAGYRFLNWTDSHGNPVSGGVKNHPEQLIVNNIAGEYTYRANFIEATTPGKVFVAYYDDTRLVSGSVTATSENHENNIQDAGVIATKFGHSFSHWDYTIDGKTIDEIKANDSLRSFYLDSNGSIKNIFTVKAEAVFNERAQFTVKLHPYADGAPMKNSKGEDIFYETNTKYYYGQTFKVNAPETIGEYAFAYWSDDETNTESVRTYVVNNQLSGDELHVSAVYVKGSTNNTAKPSAKWVGITAEGDENTNKVLSFAMSFHLPRGCKLVKAGITYSFTLNGSDKVLEGISTASNATTYNDRDFDYTYAIHVNVGNNVALPITPRGYVIYEQPIYINGSVDHTELHTIYTVVVDAVTWNGLKGN